MSITSTTGITTWNSSIKSHFAPKLLHPGWKHGEICFTRQPRGQITCMKQFCSPFFVHHVKPLAKRLQQNNIVLYHCFRNVLNSFNWFCSSNPHMYLVTCEALIEIWRESQRLQRHWWQSMQNSLQAIVPTCTKYQYSCGILGHSSGLSPNKDSVSKNVLTIPEVNYIILHQIRMSESSCTDPTQSSKYWNTTCSTACNHHSCKTTVRHTRASTKKDVLTIRILTQKWI